MHLSLSVFWAFHAIPCAAIAAEVTFLARSELLV